MSEERSGGLAPDDESRWGTGAGEPAGWLFLVSPPAGELPSATMLESPVAVPLDPALAERWLRRLAWGTDGRRATARLEVGTGRLAGAELIVTSEAGHVSIDLRLPDGADEALSERLRSRLEARGYSATITRG